MTSNAQRGGRRYAPYAFTEQGVAMLSSVLNSSRAIAVNIEIMRAFVRMRELLASNKDLAQKLAEFANPYLVAATALAGIRVGLEGRLDPRPAVTGNGYETRTASTLPRDWHCPFAQQKFSQFLQSALGTDFMKAFIAIKHQECDKFHAKVSAADYEWYLEN